MVNCLMLRALLTLFCTFALIACGGGRNPDLDAAKQIPASQKIGSQKAEVLIGEDTLVFTNGTLEGSGVVRFASPLDKTESANNFTIQIELAENSSVTLVANSNRNLAAGVEIEISRPAGSTSPHVIARTSQDSLDISTSFSNVDVTSAMHLSFDIHNDHGNSLHFLAWNEQTGEELLSDILSGRGFGANWGLKLQTAKITGIVKNGPKDKH
jgi:hypothetical protein